LFIQHGEDSQRRALKSWLEVLAVQRSAWLEVVCPELAQEAPWFSLEE
jgi:hypothetical protein